MVSPLYKGSNNMSALENMRYNNNSTGDYIKIGDFSSASFDTNNAYAYSVMYKEESSTKEELSEEVEKILEDIDSGKVNMVTQTAEEFIADMKKDLTTTQEE